MPEDSKSVGDISFGIQMSVDNSQADSVGWLVQLPREWRKPIDVADREWQAFLQSDVASTAILPLDW